MSRFAKFIVVAALAPIAILLAFWAVMLIKTYGVCGPFGLDPPQNTTHACEIRHESTEMGMFVGLFMFSVFIVPYSAILAVLLFIVERKNNQK